MGKTKGENGDGEKKKNKGEGGGDGAVTVVLKVDMHCEGCAKKVKRSVKGYEGVETVTVDSGNDTLTVVGKVDPWKLRERVEAKIHKKVVLVSPTDLPKKEEKKKDEKQEKKADEKPKEPVVSTVVLKIRLHCEGCIQRIRRSIFKVEGVAEVMIDSLKDLVTVKGSMDVNKMVPFLANKFKRTIEIIPDKKDDGSGKNDKKGKEEKKEKKDEKKEVSAEEKKGKGDGEKKKEHGGDGGEKKKEHGGAGGEKKKQHEGDDGGEKKKKHEGDDGGEKKKEHGGDDGGEKKKKHEGDGGEKKKEHGGDGGEKKKEHGRDGGEKDGGKNKEGSDGDDGAGKVEMNRMYYNGGAAVPVGYAHYGYNYPIQMVHPSDHYFSDENPNACSVM